MQHRILPADAVQQLQRAAETPIPAWDPLARVKAIEYATQQIKRRYPQLFKEEQDDSDAT